MTERTTATDQDLDWLLDRLVDQVAGTRHAILLSDDGLVISQSATIERGAAERVAAVATGQQSLARGIGELSRAARCTRSSWRWPSCGSSSHRPDRVPTSR